MKLGRRTFVLAAAACGGAALARAARAQPTALEASVKAAYLYKFTGFVEWPAGTFGAPAEPIVIGVLGADAVHAELAQMLVGRTAQERPLQARRLAPGEPADALAGLHVLFVGAGAPRDALARAAGRTLLLVTDDAAGLAAGGALNFVTVAGRVRFEASPGNAQRAGVRLSARLLGVAERVVPAGPS